MNKVCTGFLFFCFPLFVQAQNSELVIKQEIHKPVSGNLEITDPKLKADAGSLSRVSMKFNVTYAGPTVTDLSARTQPNPDGSVGTFETALMGTMGVRYRINTKSATGLSTGLKAIHPFHGTERVDLSNPALTYDYTTRIGGVQTKNMSGFVLRTVPEFQRVGQYGMLMNNQSVVFDIGTSPFAIGADLGLGYFLYDRDYSKTDGKAPRYSFQVGPNLKYSFSDKLNAFTSVNISLWNPRSKEDQFALLNKAINQRLGLGYAYNRVTYFSPYLTFYPDRFAWSGVTMNFTTIFSVF